MNRRTFSAPLLFKLSFWLFVFSLISQIGFAQKKNYLKVTIRDGNDLHTVENKFIGEVPKAIQDRIERLKGKDGEVEDMDLKIVVDERGNLNDVSFEMEKRGDNVRIFGYDQSTGDRVYNLAVDDFNDSFSFEMDHLSGLMTKFLIGNGFALNFSDDGASDQTTSYRPAQQAPSQKKAVQAFVLEVPSEDKQLEGFRAMNGRPLTELAGLSFSPNPSDGIFEVSFSITDPEKNDLSVEVFGADGRQLYMEKMRNFSGSFNRELDFSSYEKGIYFLHIKHGGQLLSRKVLIN